jgi:hypothetical protein
MNYSSVTCQACLPRTFRLQDMNTLCFKQVHFLHPVKNVKKTRWSCKTAIIAKKNKRGRLRLTILAFVLAQLRITSHSRMAYSNHKLGTSVRTGFHSRRAYAIREWDNSWLARTHCFQRMDTVLNKDIVY